MELHDLLTDYGDIGDLPPERRMLVATLGCIEEFGLKGATVRRIAARAGVNPAAVNYYYRSKDKLIEEALRSAWSHVEKDIELITREATDTDALFGIATRYLLEGAFRSPRLIRAVVAEHPTLHLEVAGFLKKLFSRMTGQNGPRKNLERGLLLLTSFVVFLGFAPNVAKVLSGVDLSDPIARDGFWTELSAHLFGRAVDETG